VVVLQVLVSIFCFVILFFVVFPVQVSVNVLSVLQVDSVDLPLHLSSPSRATQSSFVSLVTAIINRKVFEVTGPLMPVLSQLYLHYLQTHGTTSLSVSVGLFKLIEDQSLTSVWRSHFKMELGEKSY